MSMVVDGDMRDLGQDVPPAAIGGCSSLITDEQPSNANNDADQAQPMTDSTCSTADDEDDEVGSEPRRESSRSGESLEAFVAETERNVDVLAQDVLHGGGNDGDGEGNVTTSFDNSMEDASDLCSLRAELAQATPEEAGVVLIEGGGNDGDDDDDSSSSSSIGGGSTCFGVATPKAERHHDSAASNVEQGDGSSGQNAAGRGRTSPKRRRKTHIVDIK